MTIAATAGGVVDITGPTWTFTPTGSGSNLFVLVNVVVTAGGGTAASMSSSNATWSVLIPAAPAPGDGFNVTTFIGEVTSASAALVTITFTGSATGVRGGSKEFSTTAGFSSITLDTSGLTAAGATTVYPSLLPGHGAGECYWCYAYNDNTASAGSSAGFSYFVDGNGNGSCWNASCGAGAQAPVWADTNVRDGRAVLVYEASANQLLISIAGAAGLDPELGSPYSEGIFAYGALGSLIGLTIAAHIAQLQMLPGGPVTSATSRPGVLAKALGAGLVNERMLAVLTSGQESGNADAAVQVFSESADASIAAQAVIEFGGVIVLTLTAAGLLTLGGVNNPVISMVPANATHSTSSPDLSTQTQNPGAANENFLALLTSGKNGADDAALQLFSECADASVPAFAVLEFGGSTAMTVTKAYAQFNVPVQPGNGSSPGAKIWSGSGAPSLSATAGDLYIRSNGTTGSYLYRSNGGSSWTAIL